MPLLGRTAPAEFCVKILRKQRRFGCGGFSAQSFPKEIANTKMADIGNEFVSVKTSKWLNYRHIMTIPLIKTRQENLLWCK